MVKTKKIKENKKKINKAKSKKISKKISRKNKRLKYTKKARSKKTDIRIVDVPFSKSKSAGTDATLGNIQLHYQKYSNVFDFITKFNNKNTCFIDDLFLNLEINEEEMSLYPMEKISFNNRISECMKSKKRFIPIILNLITNEGNHANILLIDKKDKLVELYEPHGSRPDKSVLGGIKGAYNKKINEVKRFWRKFLPDFKVINVVDLKRGTHFQMEYDPDNHSGFCVTWSLLFIHYRILNPDIKLKDLMNYISRKITTNKLLQYARHIEDSIKNKI